MYVCTHTHVYSFTYHLGKFQLHHIFFVVLAVFISPQALKFIKSNAEQYKLRRLKTIPVSGAFHTSLMHPAVEPFKEALKKVDIVDPIIPVFSNVDGKSYRNAHHIRRQLPKQIYKPVKWEQTLHILYERKVGEYFPRTFECGPGNSLKSLLKMVNAKAWGSCFSVEA